MLIMSVTLLLKLKSAYIRILTIKALCLLIDLNFNNTALITFNYCISKMLIR